MGLFTTPSTFYCSLFTDNNWQITNNRKPLQKRVRWRLQSREACRTSHAFQNKLKAWDLLDWAVFSASVDNFFMFWSLAVSDTIRCKFSKHIFSSNMLPYVPFHWFCRWVASRTLTGCFCLSYNSWTKKTIRRYLARINRPSVLIQ